MRNIVQPNVSNVTTLLYEYQKTVGMAFNYPQTHICDQLKPYTNTNGQLLAISGYAIQYDAGRFNSWLDEWLVSGCTIMGEISAPIDERVTFNLHVPLISLQKSYREIAEKLLTKKASPLDNTLKGLFNSRSDVKINYCGVVASNGL